MRYPEVVRVLHLERLGLASSLPTDLRARWFLTREMRVTGVTKINPARATGTSIKSEVHWRTTKFRSSG